MNLNQTVIELPGPRTVALEPDAARAALRGLLERILTAVASAAYGKTANCWQLKACQPEIRRNKRLKGRPLSQETEADLQHIIGNCLTVELWRSNGDITGRKLTPYFSQSFQQLFLITSDSKFPMIPIIIIFPDRVPVNFLNHDCSHHSLFISLIIS